MRIFGETKDPGKFHSTRRIKRSTLRVTWITNSARTIVHLIRRDLSRLIRCISPCAKTREPPWQEIDSSALRSLFHRSGLSHCSIDFIDRIYKMLIWIISAYNCIWIILTYNCIWIIITCFFFYCSSISCWRPVKWPTLLWRIATWPFSRQPIALSRSIMERRKTWSFIICVSTLSYV